MLKARPARNFSARTSGLYGHGSRACGEMASCRPLFDPMGAIAALKSKVRKYPAALHVALIRQHLFDAIFEAELARKPAECGP